MSIGVCGLLLGMCLNAALWDVTSGLQCFKCVYVPWKGDGDASCSDPWPWYRDAFGKSSMPPAHECQHTCMKILIGNAEHGPTVVRTCSQYCKDGKQDNTVTSCCTTDFCNSQPSIHRQWMTYVLPAVSLWIWKMWTG